MIGLRLDAGVDARDVAAASLQRGVVVNAPNPETIRLLPALTISADDLGEGISRLRASPLRRRRRGLERPADGPDPADLQAQDRRYVQPRRRARRRARRARDTRSRSAARPPRTAMISGCRFYAAEIPRGFAPAGRLGRDPRGRRRLSRLPARPDPRSRRPGRGRGPPGTTRTTGDAADPHPAPLRLRRRRRP